MEFILVTFVACSIFWGVVAIGQYLETKNKKRQMIVPSFLARVCGSKTNRVDAGLFGLQLVSLFVFLWSVFLTLAFPQSISEVTLFWKGVFVIICIVSLVVLFRDIHQRKDKQ